jgi:hypothetical protein
MRRLRSLTRDSLPRTTRNEPEMPPPTLTNDEWRAARRRVLTRALELTKSKPKALDLTDAAIAKALEPDTTPWDPQHHKTFADYLCDIVWSLHGNETKSYRVMHASARLDEAADASAPASERPDALLLSAHDQARADRFEAALVRRIDGEALLLILLEHEPDGEAAESSGDAPGQEVSGEEGPSAAQLVSEAYRRPNAEAASTRRALAKGYTDKEIKNARERLKRHAIAVMREDEGDNEEEP